MKLLDNLTLCFCASVLVIGTASFAEAATKDRKATLPDGTQVLLRDNGTWEEIKGSVGGHQIKCKYHGGYGGFIMYAYPFTSKNEFFTKHPDGIYSLSGKAVIDGKDLDTETPITYLASKRGNTWDVVDEGLNERMGTGGGVGDGDTSKQIGKLPKVSCLIDTIIPK